MPSSLFFTIHTPLETAVHYLYNTVPAQCGSHTNSSISSPTFTHHRSVARRSKHGRAHTRSGKAGQEMTRFTLFHGQNLNILIFCLFSFRSSCLPSHKEEQLALTKRIQFLPIRATYCHGDRELYLSSSGLKQRCFKQKGKLCRTSVKLAYKAWLVTTLHGRDLTTRHQ